MVDFSDHFWGEKNTGFSVLYQNMKNGQLPVKEFSEFLKENVLLEDEYHKHLVKILKQVGNYGAVGTFGPIWVVMRGSLEKVDQTHMQLHQKYQDLLKEVQKYGEEQRHLQKSVKDKERATFESCNLIQTTTTLLQKAKETYTMRCVELEKLKRENATVKDLARAETKVKKAGDEYRQFVEKYSKVRNEFEEGMIQSARRFQEIEENHLIRMKNFVIAFATHLESCQVQLSEVCSGLKNKMEYMKIVDLLGDFISKTDTGLEKPGLITFEEPDITSLFPPQSSNNSTAATHGNFSQTPASTPTGPIATQSALSPDDLWTQELSGSPVSPVLPDHSHSLINLRLSSHSDTTFSPDSAGDVLSPSTDLPVMNSTDNNVLVLNSSLAPSQGNSMGKQSSKMSLFSNWKWKSDPKASASSSSAGSAKTPNSAPVASGAALLDLYEVGRPAEHLNELPSPSGVSAAPVTTTRSEGFLKGKISKKKAKPKDSFDQLESSDKNDQDDDVDEDGFRIKPLENVEDRKSSGNSSSDDSGDEGEGSNRKKIFVKIKPVTEMGSREKCASTDELRDALEKINRQGEAAKRTDPWAIRTVPKSNTAGELKDSSFGSSLTSYSFTDQTPFGSSHSSNTAANATFGGYSNRPNYIKPSYTGGSIASEKSDIGISKNLTQISEDGDSVFPPPLPTIGPPAVPARPRPRSTTPTHMLNLTAPSLPPKRLNSVGHNSTGNRTFSASDSKTHHLPNRSESLGSTEDLNGTGSRGPSPLGVGFSDTVPIAMAVTETFHAMFKGYDDSRCKIKIVGTLTVSFPSGIVSVLTTKSNPPPLIFQMTNVEKILPEIKPNLLLLAENFKMRNESGRVFEFNMSSLCNHLKMQCDTNPGAPYYNVNVLQYEVATSSATYDLPLQLVCFWKCEPTHTDIRVDYKYGPSGIVTAPLLNLSFIVPVDGSVQDFTSEPQSKWNNEKAQLIWHLTELSRHGDTSGSLKARLKVNSGPSHPKQLAATFQVNDMCLSGSDIQLIGSGYRISLLKRKMVSGKYTCEPEMR